MQVEFGSLELLRGLYPLREVVLWYADLIYCDLAWVASVEDCGEGKEAARTLWTPFMSIRKQI